MQVKTVPVAFKADGENAGEFEAIVSVFGNIDSYGDVVMPGAFADTLAARVESGKSFPIVFSHGSSEPDNFIGIVAEAAETDEGLLVRGSLYDTPKAQHVRRLMQDGVLDQFSFAYGVQEYRNAKRGERDVTELVKLDLYEVGPTLVGANQETRLVAVKARELAAKAGRAISAKNEKALTDAKTAMEGAIAAIEDVLAANDGEATGAGKAADRNEDDESTEDKPASAAGDDLSEAKSSDSEARAARNALHLFMEYTKG